ncbi:PilZ domain-containing protein [Sideroxydans sp. CL21]|uniref:PilZ domain-containing protein n=1 Tax=Sideroxydans sp. CL21 TaxID=2600596 RepID=UPI0024BCA0FD|nr:PilZ domain-containing protein [Sideroxydans sp. CL21]
MVEENLSNSPTGDTADLPPKDIEEIPPNTKVGSGDGVPIADVIPTATADQRKTRDIHDEPHPHFKWHAEVRVDGHDVFQGIVKDISMKGLNLVLDHNLQNSKLVKLHIHIPPADISSPHHVLEVSGKITSTVFDSAEEAFRSSISFIQFTLDSDQTYLQSLLS